MHIKKEVVNDNDDYDDDDDDDAGEKKKTAEDRLSLVDSCGLMPGKLSDLVDNLSGIHYKECKKCATRKKIRSECKFIGHRNNRLNYRCKEFNKPCFKSPNKAINNFPILHQFCKDDLNKFFLLLGKSYYSYEDADSWENFDETIIPPIEAFYNELYLGGIRDADYPHVQKYGKYLK